MLRNVTEPPFTSFEDALDAIDQVSFLTVGCYTMAVLKFDGICYIFYPHSRNDVRLSCSEGKAFLTNHTSDFQLAEFVRHLAATNLPKNGPQLFEVTTVRLTMMQA